VLFIIEELVKKAKNYDRAAMDEILEKFKYFVYKQAGKYIIPSYDYEDLVQHGYLSIIKAVHQYNLDKRSFTTYCTNAVINNYNALLKRKIKHFREIQDQNILDMQVYDFTLEDEVIAYEQTKKLQVALDNLQELERRIIYSVYMEGMNLKEAAADSDVNYRKAIEIRKKSLIKLRDHL